MNGIKKLRRLLDLTRKEFADALGVHEQTVFNWESNIVPPKGLCYLSKMIKLGEKVGMTYKEILEWKK